MTSGLRGALALKDAEACRISTALWLLEQSNAPASCVSQLRVWADAKFLKKGETTQSAREEDEFEKSDVDETECSKPKRVKDRFEFQKQRVIAWVHKRFEVLEGFDIFDFRCPLANLSVDGIDPFVLMLSMPPEVYPVLGKGGSLENEETLCEFVRKDCTDIWPLLVKLACVAHSGELLEAIFHNFLQKGHDQMELGELEEGAYCFPYFFQALYRQDTEIVQMMIKLAKYRKIWFARLFFGNMLWVSDSEYLSPLHIAVKHGWEELIEVCMSVERLHDKYFVTPPENYAQKAQIKKFVATVRKCRELMSPFGGEEEEEEEEYED